MLVRKKAHVRKRKKNTGNSDDEKKLQWKNNEAKVENREQKIR